MNLVKFNGRSCETYRRYFDAYLDNELLVETNQDVVEHLESCADCTRLIESRVRIKQLLKNAVAAEEAPAVLAEQLRHRFRARPGFFSRDTVRWMIAAAAVLALAIGGVETLRWGYVIGVSQPAGVVETVSARVQELLRVGLVDHVHCAIVLERWKRFISFEEMKADSTRSALGPEFIDLVPAVQARLGPYFKMVQGHRCTANHRQYIHLILTGDKGAIVSLVITEKRGESFAQADAVAVINASGLPIYRDRQGILEIAGFESDKYLAYVVSNLNHDSNLNVASTIAPLVYSHLHRLEV
ncbi:MAG: hypothetical protein DMG17_10395 [Acidobacteria bacterium]|nr:MAG: hypothetical protein DMG17_10395 [Acidobacteriota bacterium]